MQLHTSDEPASAGAGKNEAVTASLDDVLRILPKDVVQEQIWPYLDASGRQALLGSCTDLRKLTCSMVQRFALLWKQRRSDSDHSSLLRAARTFPGARRLCTHVSDNAAATQLAWSLGQAAVAGQARSSVLGSFTTLHMSGDYPSGAFVPADTLAVVLSLALPNLQQLHVRFMDMRAAMLPLTHLTHMLHLELRDLTMDDECVKVLPQLTALTSLTLCNYNWHVLQQDRGSHMDEYAVNSLGLFRRLASMTRLCSLVLLDSLLEVDHLAKLSALTGLTRLALGYTASPPCHEDWPLKGVKEGSGYLGYDELRVKKAMPKFNRDLQHLLPLTQLVQLELPDLVLRDGGMPAIAAMTQLRHLSVGDLALSPELDPGLHAPSTLTSLCALRPVSWHTSGVCPAQLLRFTRYGSSINDIVHEGLGNSLGSSSSSSSNSSSSGSQSQQVPQVIAAETTQQADSSSGGDSTGHGSAAAQAEQLPQLLRVTGRSNGQWSLLHLNLYPHEYSASIHGDEEEEPRQAGRSRACPTYRVPSNWQELVADDLRTVVSWPVFSRELCLTWGTRCASASAGRVDWLSAAPFLSAVESAAATLRTLRLMALPVLDAESMEVLVRAAPGLRYLSLAECKLREGALLPLLGLPALCDLSLNGCWLYMLDLFKEVVGLCRGVSRPLRVEIDHKDTVRKVREQLAGEQPLVQVTCM